MVIGFYYKDREYDIENEGILSLGELIRLNEVDPETINRRKKELQGIIDKRMQEELQENVWLYLENPFENNSPNSIWTAEVDNNKVIIGNIDLCFEGEFPELYPSRIFRRSILTLDDYLRNIRFLSSKNDPVNPFTSVKLDSYSKDMLVKEFKEKYKDMNLKGIHNLSYTPIIIYNDFSINPKDIDDYQYREIAS